MNDIPDWGPFDPSEYTESELAEGARLLNEGITKAIGGMENQFFGMNTATASNAMVDDTLTIEKLQGVIEGIGNTLVETYRKTPPFGFTFPPLPCPLPAFGVPIYTSPYLGDTVYPEAPAMKSGPYLKRRIKRWHRAHPAYTVGNGQYFTMKDQIWCHPDDLHKLQQAIDTPWVGSQETK